MEAIVYFKGKIAGKLIRDEDKYIFFYDDQYLNDHLYPSISLTLPKSKKRFINKDLFPFFFNMLPEGVNKDLICRLHRIDPKDYFKLLLHVAGHDTIGAVTVKPAEAR